MTFLVVFRSKSETIKFINILASYGHRAILVNTPRQISVSCGVSAKIANSALEASILILKRRQFYTYAGIYKFNNNEYDKI